MIIKFQLEASIWDKIGEGINLLVMTWSCRVLSTKYTTYIRNYDEKRY